MANQSMQETLRHLPSVEEVLRALEPYPCNDAVPRALRADIVRGEIAQRRNTLLAGNSCKTDLTSVTEAAAERLKAAAHASLRRVINATGIIIHTNLGRSVLAEEAVKAVLEAARGYSTLEYDVRSMKRGSRHDHCEQLLCTLTGAEAAMAVNNNAAAVMMILNEFAHNKQAVISRGELIEIGGSFRIPDIMKYSQATMVEVGTTNKTHLSDYARAITDETAILLKVHTSNYRLIGFTESVPTKELRKLADSTNNERKARSLPLQPQKSNQGTTSPDGIAPLMVYEDLGSGLLFRPAWLHQDQEPTVSEALSQGCDLVSFSGDKLLGGPQAGIIVGSKTLIDRLKKNPLARALRLDKMTIAALEATLRLYLDPEKAQQQIPTLRMLTMPAEKVEKIALRLKEELERSDLSSFAHITISEEVARSGGGSLPMFDIPSYAVSVHFKKGSAQDCHEHLVQNGPIPIIARINRDTLLFDARTLIDDEDIHVIAQELRAYFEHLQDPKRSSRFA